jgi:PAS domain S-box-containing protein
VDSPTELLAVLVDHLQIGVFALDPAGRIVLWNAEAERLTGHSKSEALGADALSLGIPARDDSAAKEIMARLLAGQGWSGEFPIHGAGGRPALFHTVPVFGDGGDLVGIVSVFSDASERRRLEETLSLLDGLFENAPVGFAYVDTDLRYRRVNRSVAVLNGGSVEDRLGRTIDEVHGEPCGPQFSAICRDVIRTGEARQVRIEGRLWHGSGPHQVWRMNYYPVFGNDGEVIGVGDVFIDVTETERNQRELVRLATARRQIVTRYQSLIEATSAAVWTVDASGKPLPDPGGEVRSQDGFLAAVHPDDQVAVGQRWHEAMAAGAVFDQVARLRVAGGSFRHFRVRAVPVVIEGRLTEWIGTETDIEAEVRAHGRLELLARATDLVNRELEPVAELQALADVLVPAFADGCTVHLIDPLVPAGPVTGRRLLSRVELDLTNGRGRVDAFSYSGDHPFVELVRTRRPLLLEHPLRSGARWAREAELARWERELGWHTSLLAPILSGSTVIAVLALVAWGDRPRYTSEDLTFVGELASRASVAVEHAQRFQEARRAALTLQKAMLTEPPRRPDVAIEARYQPALDNLEVGGDWYDAFTLPGGDLGLVVGDVLGHDLEAATVMGQLRSMFRGIAMDDALEPAAAVERLNELVIALQITSFTTLLYGRLRLDPDGGASLTWSSAGHPPALLIGQGAEPRSLTAGGGTALGIKGRGVRTTGRARLGPGSTLLLYTDGLVERRSMDLDEATAQLETLVAEIARAPLCTFCDELLARSQADTGDDIALLAVRLTDPTEKIATQNEA